MALVDELAIDVVFDDHEAVLGGDREEILPPLRGETHTGRVVERRDRVQRGARLPTARSSASVARSAPSWRPSSSSDTPTTSIGWSRMMPSARLWVGDSTSATSPGAVRTAVAARRTSPTASSAGSGSPKVNSMIRSRRVFCVSDGTVVSGS
jgi:hypothetical protein